MKTSCDFQPVNMKEKRSCFYWCWVGKYVWIFTSQRSCSSYSQETLFLWVFLLFAHVKDLNNLWSHAKKKKNLLSVKLFILSYILLSCKPWSICVPAGTWPSSTLCSSACPPQRPRWWWVWSGFWLCSWLFLSTTIPTRLRSLAVWCVTSTGQNTLCLTSKRCEWVSLASSYSSQQA